MKNVFIATEDSRGTSVVVLVSHSQRKLLSVLKNQYKLDKDEIENLREYGNISLWGERYFYSLNIKEYQPNVYYGDLYNF